MIASDLRIPLVETRRWSGDGVLLSVVIGAGVLGAVLSAMAVLVAAGSTSGGSGGLQIQTDVQLTSASQDADLVGMARSGVAMLVPLVAIIVGVRAAGSEMASGALLQVAVAARRLRGVVVAAASLAGAQAGVAADADLASLSAWSGAGTVMAGAAAQAGVLALLAFSLAALTRRWVLVLVALLVYLVVLEPVIAGLLGDGASWLPREATSSLLTSDADLGSVLPVALVALALTVVTVAWRRRDRTAR
jgi:hypothetical protein